MATEANSGSFSKGNPGKPKGAISKTTKLVKEVFAEVFSDIQSHPSANLKSWAISEPTEFYKLASKLIPTQINAEVNLGLKDEPITFE